MQTALALVVAAAVYLAPSIAPPRVGPAPKVPTLVPRFAAVGEIQFTDARHGLLLLYTQNGQPAPGSYLYSTADAGRHWTLVKGLPGGRLLNFHLFDARRGYLAIVADQGDGQAALLTTRDGGATWQRASLLADVSLPPIPAG